MEVYKLSTKILTIICIILMSSVLIFTILTMLKQPVVYCETDKCIRSAASMKFSMNVKADPCQDFFEYTCGRWPRENFLSPNYKKFTKFSQITERINSAAQKFLSDEDAEDEIFPVKQSRMFYRSCVNKTTEKNEGFTYIFEYLRRLELPTIPRLIFNGSNGNEKFDWTRTEVKLKRIMGLQTFIAFDITLNPRNVSENVMYMGIPRTQCRHRSLRKLIKYVVQQIILNITSEMIPEKIMAEAYFIIRNITGFLCRYGNKSFPKESDKMPYKFEDLQEEIDRHMSEKMNHTEPEFLHSYVGHIFDGIEGVNIDFQLDLLYIRNSTKSFLLDILTYTYSLPEVYVEFYLWWNVVKRMISYTHLNEFVRRIEKPHDRIRTNALSGRAIELSCAKEVTTFMYYAVTYGIAQRKIKTSTGQQVKIMVKRMRDELRNNIERADWLDEKTKTANLEKLENMNSFIGIPDWLFEEGELEKYYRKVGGKIEINDDTCLRNKLQVIELESTKHYESFRNHHIISTYKFPKSPLIVNAFHIYTRNSIVIPMAITTFPLFDLGLDELNYGAVGVLLGHELIHGFDTLGITFDKYGNNAKFWSEKSERVFQEKCRCFVEQYGNMTIEGTKGYVSGLKTINENIADNGGLNIAHSALKKYELTKSEQSKLVGFENFTSSQLFFIAFGSMWCYTSTSEHAEYLLNTDIHSPPSVRVNVAVQNSNHFAEAFNCAQGSPMNPAHKCEIW